MAEPLRAERPRDDAARPAPRPGRCRLFCALDTSDLDHALKLAAAVGLHADGLKLGLQFFHAAGPDGARAVAEASGLPLFFDLKLHDIPNTVAGAMRSLRPLAPYYVTVHAAGGCAVVRAACEMAAENAAATGLPATRILGVTVLTSMDDGDLRDTGVTDPAAVQVRRLSALAAAAGCGGIVSSPWEIAAVRETVGPDIDVVIPGVRPSDWSGDDQKRVMTAGMAAEAGADAIVVGRPITSSPDPAAAARAVAAELR